MENTLNRLTGLRRSALFTTVLMLGAGLLVGTNVVAADSIQVQSYQRVAETAECPHQPWETPWQADWGPDSSWTPSWEWWPNNGTGGWTCTRIIVWAKSPPPVSDSDDTESTSGVPTAVTGAAGDSQVTVSWTAPTNDGGSAITSYTATSHPGAFTCTTATTSCDVTGLTNGTAYTFTVTATNAVGTSAPSTPSAAVTPTATLTAPGSPTAVTGAAGDGEVTVSWTAPTNDGGSAITSYTATSNPGSFTCTTATTSCDVTGLTNGTAYTFTVTATNAVGTSAPSSASDPITPALSCSAGGACALGDIGPGGGLVFLISGSKTYEMAPKTWSGGAADPSAAWCSDTTNSVTTNTGVGTGAANTARMTADCTSGAANSASAYRGGNYADWFLPSKDEMKAMCDYSREPGKVCGGAFRAQDATFAAGAYGFTETGYWSSSESDATKAWYTGFSGGGQDKLLKSTNARVRPIRAF